MADDNTLRSYRTSDTHRRPAESIDHTSDPLADLARLIGQTDPFAEIARSSGSGGLPPMLHDAPPTAADWRQHVERPSYVETAPADADADYRYDPAFAAASQHADDRYDPAVADYPAYDESAPMSAEPHHEQFYDDPPVRRTRTLTSGSGLVFSGLLACCALVGVASAYGYRAFSSSGASSGPAPVIVADKSPSKIVPAAAEQKARLQDRVAAPGTERLAPPPEQPAPLPGSGAGPRLASVESTPPAVEPPETTAQTTTGSTTAASVAPAVPAADVVLPPPRPSPPSSVAAGEPKRIKTVPIRPNGGDASSRPRVAAAPAHGAPLSLDPTAAQNAQASAPSRGAQRLTPPAPREGTRDAQRLASAPDHGGTGGYVVQVSSQRSEADARSSYRALQAKYAQLRSRTAMIRRADLGKRGTYYRAMVGPFSSPSDAERFCSGLKSAGGQCVILRN